MRRPFLLLSLVLAGCGASAPVRVASVPVEPVADVELAPVAVAAPEIVEIEPSEPPPSARDRIVRRSVYEGERVAEWELQNGLTVVYTWDDDAADYHARLEAPGGWASLDPAASSRLRTAAPVRWGALGGAVGPDRRRATGRADRLADVLGAVVEAFEASGGVADAFDRPEAFTLFVAGPVAWEWAEATVAGPVATVRGRGRFTSAPAEAARQPGEPAALRARADWDDWPAALVAGEVVAERVGARVQTTFDGRFATLTTDAEPAGALGAASRAEVEAARDRAALRAATPLGRLDAVAALWAVPGRFRPAHPPEEAASLPARIARVSPARVDAALRRWAGAAPTAGFFDPPADV